jgi:predicted Zn-dependent protease with MMP-like domain
MYLVEIEQFEQMVSSGLLAVPLKFREQLVNVAFVVEEYPTPGQLKKAGLTRDGLLFGLYEGIPLTKRGNNYAGVLPDKISIFKHSLELVASSELDLSEKVKQTVMHEVAHYFGMEEARVRSWEKKRKS